MRGASVACLEYNFGAVPEESEGRDVVIHAVGQIHKETVRAFLERPVADAPPADRQAVLMRAALIGDAAAVRELLDRGARADERDAIGRTPLIEAAFAGHSDTVAVLLERGADPTATDNAGWTALMEAASKGHTETVKTLLFNGADSTYRNARGWSALRATPRSHIDIIRLLKESNAAVTCHD
ncbi:MAG: ankyrin repeat domain-containing protein [Blastocatellia bacterium]